MTLPNFLIIGAAKSGTTALYHYLKQHPEVFMSPQKETNFFAFAGQTVRFNGPGDEQTAESAITTLGAYEEQFGAASGEKVIGEASPWYLYSERAAANIRHSIPDAKMIAMLRNPVDRAFSSYLHVVRDGRESEGFTGGLRTEEVRIARGWEPVWHYRRAGLYSEQVRRFLDLFDREQVRFFLYEDFQKDADAFLVKVYEFLGVDPHFVADTSLRTNTSGVPKNKLLERLVFQPNPLKTAARVLLPDGVRYDLSQRLGQRAVVKPSLDPGVREKLLRTFEHDIGALQDLTGLDLSAWQEGESAEHP